MGIGYPGERARGCRRHFRSRAFGPIAITDVSPYSGVANSDCVLRQENIFSFACSVVTCLREFSRSSGGYIIRISTIHLLFVSLTIVLLHFAVLDSQLVAQEAVTPVIATSLNRTSGKFNQPAAEEFPQLFVWTDTCNVYVLRDADTALLIDLGDGSVLGHLSEIGVSKVSHVLFTHHHREQCQGIDRLDRVNTQVLAPLAERDLFEKPTDFRKWFPTLGDKYTVYGASFVRPPSQPVRIDKVLVHNEEFNWMGHQIKCLSTPGHSPGGMTYLIQSGGKTAIFSGGVVHSGARMSTWFDSEWDYGFAAGIDTLMKSVDLLKNTTPGILFPSHGPPIPDAGAKLERYGRKLKTFRDSYVRGYPVFNSTAQQRDSYSKPTAVPHINRVTPHLYKLSHKTSGKNFAIIISDKGKGLILDCGLFPASMLEEMVVGMRTHLGLKDIDAFWISHMHGDHFLLGPTLKQKYGAVAWTLDRIVDKCENPRRYDYAALVSAYGDGFDGMRIEKSFKDGETVQWEGYTIHVDWMPGQTEFGCCLWLEIDGKRVAFTGDNLFGTPSDPSQNGHEAVVARNSAILEEGYIQGSNYLRNLKPDIVMGSHSYLMDNPAEFLERYHQWSLEIAKLYRDLLPDTDYEYLYDPYWVSAYPYRVDLSKENSQEVQVTVRNFRNVVQRHRIELKLPRGIIAEPSVLEGEVAAEGRHMYKVRLSVDRSAATSGIQIVPFDIRLDEKKYGELFDFLVRTHE